MFDGRNEKEAKKLFKKLALRLHPDHGGTNELMMILTESYERHIENLKMIDDAFTAFTPPEEEAWEEQSLEDLETYNRTGVYAKVIYDIYLNDPRLDIIQKIKKYGETHKKFNTGYTESIEEYLEENEFITCNQFNSLVKIFYAFKMDKKS
jgi:hypothetical protein